MKKIMSIFALSFVLIIGLSACGSDNPQKNDSSNDTSVGTTEEKASVIEVNSDEAKALIKEGAILLDVRTQGEYDEKHIEGSMLIPLDSLDTSIEEKIKDKDTKIIVYCRSGRRSGIAAESLINAGYTAVYDLGAMSSWEE